MTTEQVRKMLQGKIETAGGLNAWARAAGVSPSYVSEVLAGRKEPGAKLLDALRLVRVVTYRRAL